MTMTDWQRSPIELGLPAKFRKWRYGQAAAVQRIVETEGLTPLNLPTGSGKSLIYVAAAKLLGGRTVFLTSTKALQQQLMTDFSRVGMVKVMGKGNYPCLQGSWLVDGDALCSLLTCDLQRRCHYYIALRIARRASMVCTNYSYFLTLTDLGEFDHIVCDEAHLLPQVLESFLSTSINFPLVSEVLGTPHEIPCDSEDWRAWVRQNGGLLAQAILSAVQSKDEDSLARLLPVRRMFDKLPAILEGRHLIREEQNGIWRFQSIMPSGYFLTLLAKRLTLVSATLTDKILGQCQLEGKTQYFDSPFPPEQHPVILASACKVSHKMSDQDRLKLVRGIDEVIGSRLDRKGIVHVSSYKWAEDIVAMSQRKAVFWPHSPRDLQSVVEAFRRASAPAVLISPSIGTGYDFAYDDCSYQIIAKVMFPDLRDPLVAAKRALDKEFYANFAIQSVIQACGRGMRSSTDYCETFVLDAHFKWLIKAYRHLFPTWFLKTLRWDTVIPQPLPWKYMPWLTDGN